MVKKYSSAPCGVEKEEHEIKLPGSWRFRRCFPEGLSHLSFMVRTIPRFMSAVSRKTPTKNNFANPAKRSHDRLHRRRLSYRTP